MFGFGRSSVACTFVDLARMFENLKADFWISLYSSVSTKSFKKNSFVRGGAFRAYQEKSASVCWLLALGARLSAMYLHQLVCNVFELDCM